MISFSGKEYPCVIAPVIYIVFSKAESKPPCNRSVSTGDFLLYFCSTIPGAEIQNFHFECTYVTLKSTVVC